VPEANRLALERAHAAGVLLAVVTGRRLPSVLPSIAGLGIDPLLVLNGGALVKDGMNGPILRRELLPTVIGRKVLAVGRQAGVEPVVHDGPNGEGNIIIESGRSLDRSLAAYLEGSDPPPRHVPDLALALVRDPVQIMFVSQVGAVRALEAELAARLERQVSLARTEYVERDFALLDVLAAGAGKAAALRFIAARHGVCRERTMAIGDNWNDLAMLEAAGLGVAMANAPEELRSRFEVTGGNDEAGVAQAIERYVL
jgi:Cof subfamily protein (haloacid dehalogenase superfamily)